MKKFFRNQHVMKKFSRDGQVVNCLLALSLWAEVKPEDVFPGLDDWRCGTQACFGGHLVTWPEFQAMGVEQHPDGGYPSMRDGPFPSRVAEIFFGDSDMFRVRYGHGVDESGMSDYGVVVNRLEARIEELTS